MAEWWKSLPQNRMCIKKIKNKKRMKGNEDSLRDLWGNIKCTNICIIGVPEGGEREKRPEKIFEKMIAENFPNMEKEIVNQVQEVQRVPGRMNPKRNTSRHIVIKLTKIKDKDKILKATREKQQVTYKGNPICLTADFSAVLKGKNLQPRFLYPARISLKIYGEIKNY